MLDARFATSCRGFLFGVGSFLGRIISGFLFDRLNAAYVSAAGNLLAAIATVSGPWNVNCSLVTAR